MRRVVVFAVLVPMTLMVVACGEDGPTTLAEGDVEFVGSDGLGGQSVNITAEEQDGEVTGEIRFTDDDNEDSTAVVTVECADTDTDGVVILGGEITSSSDSGGGSPAVGELIALFIREGDPDSAALWLDDGENSSCSQLLANRQDVLDDDSAFVDVESGDIETG